MACCILGAMIIMALLTPVRRVKSLLYRLGGIDVPVDRAEVVASWRPDNR